jgi:N-acetylglucosaminyl-diphospho-decaprenol L-rhamnosyltransferase
MGGVDVVVVSYNSRDRLRACVEPLAGLADVQVIVVDNASQDASLEVVADLPVHRVPQPRNGGFAYGVNAGWKRGRSPYVLLLNPDARLDAASLSKLVGVLERHPDAGAAAPRILHEDGSLDHSLRRFPRLRSTYAQALFIHRVLPLAGWTDEVVRDPHAYEHITSPEWVSGACILVRRTSLEALEGLDESFFLYCEDVDLAKRLRGLGQRIVYEPAAVAIHAGGASTPAGTMLPVLAASRIHYARKHLGRLAALDRIGVALGALTHAGLARGGRSGRRGHAHALAVAMFGAEPRVAGRARHP